MVPLWTEPIPQASTAFMAPSRTIMRRRVLFGIELSLLAFAAVFLALHAVHLRADFPNHSPWMDWAKYTDEGWYGDGAIRHFQRGAWYVPGDFNPAAALPVWPLIESIVFRVTGVNVVAARGLTVGIFALILLSVYILLRRWQAVSQPGRPRSLAPAVAVVLLAVSPFCYVFTRMAILEPMLILLTLLAMVAASYLPQWGEDERLSSENRIRKLLPILALGILLPLMVLTKTTAIFLLPSIAWLIFSRAGYRIKPALKFGAPVALLAILIWGVYYAIVVRPHFLGDYKYLFTANAYTGITSQNFFEVLGDGLTDGMWVGPLLYPLALLSMVISFLIKPRLLRNPLIPALLLWIAGYAAFIAYHNNLQPRYYLVIVVPLTLLTVVVFAKTWSGSRPLYSPLALICGAALATVAVTDVRQTMEYVLHPEYSFADAANRIRRIVDSDPAHNPLVLSISGSDLSLMTGLPSICDDFGTMDLDVRVKAYRPGWYVAWNQVDDDKMDALASVYRLNRVASFPAMDDPERNLLILYRLDPIPAAPTQPVRPHAATRLLQTASVPQANPIRMQH